MTSGEGADRGAPRPRAFTPASWSPSRASARSSIGVREVAASRWRDAWSEHECRRRIRRLDEADLALVEAEHHGELTRFRVLGRLLDNEFAAAPCHPRRNEAATCQACPGSQRPPRSARIRTMRPWLSWRRCFAARRSATREKDVRTFRDFQDCHDVAPPTCSSGHRPIHSVIPARR